MKKFVMAFITIFCLFFISFSVFAEGDVESFTISNDTEETVYVIYDYAKRNHGLLLSFILESEDDYTHGKKEYKLSPYQDVTIDCDKHCRKKLYVVGREKNVKVQTGECLSVSLLAEDSGCFPRGFCKVTNNTSKSINLVHFWKDDEETKSEEITLNEGEVKIFKSKNARVKIKSKKYMSHFLSNQPIWKVTDFMCVPLSHIKVINDTDEKKTVIYHFANMLGGYTKSVSIKSGQAAYISYRINMMIQVDGYPRCSVRPGDTWRIEELLKKI